MRSTDLPTNDPYTADFDGDQIGNWDELLQGTDPLAAANTDANGLPDDWEKFYFGQTEVDPNAGAPGGGGLTNLQHFQLGSNPNLPPPLDPLLQAPPPVTITASPATLGQSAATLLYPADDSQLLLQNGNFSAPALPTPVRWSIFGVRTDYPNGGIPGWTALSGSLIELQQIAVNPVAGAGQYCELDAHWPTSLHLGPSDHGIQQTVNLARGRYLLFFDYRGRATNARSFTVKASSGPGMIFGLPNPSLKLRGHAVETAAAKKPVLAVNEAVEKSRPDARLETFAATDFELSNAELCYVASTPIKSGSEKKSRTFVLAWHVPVNERAGSRRGSKVHVWIDAFSGRFLAKKPF